MTLSAGGFIVGLAENVNLIVVYNDLSQNDVLIGRNDMPDKALEALDELFSKIKTYLDNHYSEADTRVKFIDPLLTLILGWDEFLHIKREENYRNDEQRRCIDYVLSLEDPVLVVEAKKNLTEFEMPTTVKNIDYSLSGVMQNWKNAWSAIKQSQEYCVRQGARYALVTNGRQYIAFKAISERGSWLKGHALVLGSPAILRENFTLFYECLSRYTISQDKLSDLAFPKETSVFREKPRSFIKVPNSGYRNELYSILDAAFRDILLDVPQGNPEFLRECYCSSEDAMRYGGHLNGVLVDPIPNFRTPIAEIRPGHKKDAFNETIGQKNLESNGVPLFVVMGGLGVGKTSFLNWYFKNYMEEKAKENSVVVFCDYRTIECTTEELHRRTLKIVIDEILSQTEQQTTNFNQLSEMFRKRIDRELKGALKPFVNNPEEKDKMVSALLQQLQDYSPEHLKTIVDYLKSRIGKRVIVVLDNMDQKSPELQDKLYQIGNELVYNCSLIVVVSIRESTFRRITRSATFNAFASREFHVKAQPVDLILEKRLAFLRNRLSKNKVSIPISAGTVDILDLDRFIQLIRRSLLSGQADSRILECITAISNGNIREQLNMFYSFLVSGQTKIEDYFWNYARNKTACIPFHEVMHSILYEDHKFFDEGASHRFMNIFEPSPGRHASHFTSLRILSYLHKGLGQMGDLRPTDFIDQEELIEEFGRYGWSKEEISFQVNRMAQYGLMMPESGDLSDYLSSQRCALTKCGIYYLNTLYADFTYFSAMGCDTNIMEQETVNTIVGTLQSAMSRPKISLSDRRAIAERFVGYLDSREQIELKGATSKHPVVGHIRFVPQMISAVRSIPTGT
ncbi:MAG: P-loop NTPase fold protein [Planctomycetota bacterium]